MDKYLFVGYRDWSIRTHSELNLPIPIINTTEDLKKAIMGNSDLRYIFFVGWSNFIEEGIIQNFECFCIHPSSLPLYRGGSPIQNQIIDGVLDSSVTLFKMNNEIDSGPIFAQKYLSLTGSLNDIFNRISYASSDLIRDFIFKIESGKEVLLIDQDDSKSTFCKRRKPSQSEIKIEEIQNSTALQLYNKIRSLDDPYPNAYITCVDGKKLFIKKVEIE